MPEVRRGFAFAVGHGEFGLGARWRVGRELARTGYDHAILLPNSLKSTLPPWFARIPVRTGFLGQMR
jgi:heptosyltransferase-2